MGSDLVKRPEPKHLRLRATWVPWWGRVAVGGLIGLLVGPILAGFGTPAAVVGGAAAVTLVWFFVRVGTYRDKRLGDMMPLLQLAVAGHVDEAADGFAALAEQQTNDAVRAGDILMLGYLRMRQQRFDEAIALLTEVTRGSTIARMRTVARAEIAECRALAGDLDGADAFLRKTYDARRNAPAATSVVWAMLGKHDKVLTLKFPRTAKSLRPYVVHEPAVFALMKAFSSHVLGREFAEHHAAAQPGFEGEFAYLTDNWPALAQFVADHPWDGFRASPAQLPPARVVR